MTNLHEATKRIAEELDCLSFRERVLLLRDAEYLGTESQYGDGKEKCYLNWHFLGWPSEQFKRCVYQIVGVLKEHKCNLDRLENYRDEALFRETSARHKAGERIEGDWELTPWGMRNQKPIRAEAVNANSPAELGFVEWEAAPGRTRKPRRRAVA